jgi:hypothetical protein
VKELETTVDKLKKQKTRLETLIKQQETIKFPVKDELLLSLPTIEAVTPLPQPNQPFKQFNDIIPDILAIWEFFCTFR